MSQTVPDATSLERVCAELEALDGVQRAFAEPDPFRVYVVSETAEAPHEALVRSTLSAAGLPAGEAQVFVSHLHEPEPRRRVRFVNAAIEATSFGRASAKVELEWSGQVYGGEAEGEAGAALELRLVAAATLTALARVLDRSLRIQLVGVRTLRAFDTDVVVVLLSGDPGSLVGSALDGGDPVRSAALAVLNATNRVFGNYLAVPSE